MKQRGRKSAAKLAVVAPTIDSRPEPPDDLLEHEKAMWRGLTASRTAEFFDVATFPLLAEFCRLKTQADLIAAQIASFDPDWLITDEGVKRYAALTTIRDKAQGRMVILARSMRLTPQSRYIPDKKTNKPNTVNKRVWQREG